MRIFISTLLISLFLASCNHKPAANATNGLTDTVFTIAGSISGLDTGTVIFVHRSDDKRVYDTVNLKGGVFEFKGKVPATEGMTAYTCFVSGKDDDAVEVMVENAHISFTGKADSFQNVVIKGSGVQAEWDSFGKITAPVDLQMQALGKLYNATKDKTTLDSINKAYDRYDSILQSFVPPFVKQHQHSVMSAYIIERTLLIQPKAEVVEPVYNSLDSMVRQSRHGKVIAEVLDACKKTAVGQIAPDFTMNHVSGKPLTLSSLRGKYILLDFWASWCGPCRKENPSLVAAYTKFHSPEFDILSVSLDTKQEKWEEAIAKDKLIWQHVSDLKGWGNEAAKLYGIRAIPANLLLDKDGRIIDRNIFGAELQKKLARVLK